MVSTLIFTCHQFPGLKLALKLKIFKSYACFQKQREKEGIFHLAQGSILEGIRDCYLHQHVAEPTHHCPNQQANILDLILTNEEGMVSHMVHSVPLGKSHHSVLLFTLHVYKEPAPFKSRYIFEKRRLFKHV